VAFAAIPAELAFEDAEEEPHSTGGHQDQTHHVEVYSARLGRDGVSKNGTDSDEDDSLFG
jgi:hypothetical protein